MTLWLTFIGAGVALPTAQRANLLIEAAANFVQGDAALLARTQAAWELRLMLRFSLTRHARL